MRKKRCGSGEEINIFSCLVGNGRQKEIGYGIVSCFFILELSRWLGENHVHRRNKQLTSYQSWLGASLEYMERNSHLRAEQNKSSANSESYIFFFFEEQGRLTINCEILTGTSATLDTHTHTHIWILSHFWSMHGLESFTCHTCIIIIASMVGTWNWFEFAIYITARNLASTIFCL